MMAIGFCIDCGEIISSGTRCYNCTKKYYKREISIEKKIPIGAYETSVIREHVHVRPRANWNNLRVRRKNVLKISKVIKKAPRSHAEIKRLTGLGKTAVRDCIAYMKEIDILIEHPCGSKKMVQLKV